MYSFEKDFDPRGSAQSMVDMLTEEIANHDAAVNAELLAQRDRLLAALKNLVRLHLGEYSPLESTLPVWDEARYAIAESEQST